MSAHALSDATVSPTSSWQAGVIPPPLAALDPAHCAAAHAAYVHAKPFPYTVLSGVFSTECLAECVQDFERIPREDWSQHCTGLQKKRTFSKIDQLPAATKSYFDCIYSRDFIAALETITGIPGLQPDRTLFGGGLHEVSQQGHFEIHVDFQRHPVTRLRNRLVVITYLNRDWSPDDGGALQLWEMSPPKAIVSIPPLFGHTLLMSQSTIAAHGFPDAVRPGLRRRALVAYFYTSDGRQDDKVATSTVYLTHPRQPLSRRLLIAVRLGLPPSVVTTARQMYSKLVTFGRRA